MENDVRAVISNWFKMIDGLKYSSEKFYKSVESEILARGGSAIKTQLVKFSEGGLGSAKRVYLRVKRKGYMFDICAAPYGDSFFISWWFTSPPGFIENLLLKIPLLGALLIRAFKGKTMYQADTFNMFQQFVHSSITKVIDQINEEKGLRLLSEEDKKPIINNNFI